MKVITAVRLTAALILAASVTAYAQETNSGTGSDAGKGGQGDKHQRPSPEQTAKELMTKYDANKDGKLTQDELTQGLEYLRQLRSQGGKHGGGTDAGKSDDSAKSSQGDQNGQTKNPPSADKAAAKMIEKYSSDKSSLTEAELAKALKERRGNRGRHGDDKGGGDGEHGEGQAGGTDGTHESSK